RGAGAAAAAQPDGDPDVGRADAERRQPGAGAGRTRARLRRCAVGGADRAGARRRRVGGRPGAGAGAVPPAAADRRRRAERGARMNALCWAFLLPLPGLLLTALGVGRKPGTASLPGPLAVGLAGALFLLGDRSPRTLSIADWLPL